MPTGWSRTRQVSPCFLVPVLPVRSSPCWAEATFPSGFFLFVGAGGDAGGFGHVYSECKYKVDLTILDKLFLYILYLLPLLNIKKILIQ